MQNSLSSSRRDARLIPVHCPSKFTDQLSQYGSLRAQVVVSGWILASAHPLCCGFHQARPQQPQPIKHAVFAPCRQLASSFCHFMRVGISSSQEQGPDLAPAMKTRGSPPTWSSFTLVVRTFLLRGSCLTLVVLSELACEEYLPTLRDFRVYFHGHVQVLPQRYWWWVHGTS